MQNTLLNNNLGILIAEPKIHSKHKTKEDFVNAMENFYHCTQQAVWNAITREKHKNNLPSCSKSVMKLKQFHKQRIRLNYWPHSKKVAKIYLEY